MDANQAFTTFANAVSRFAGRPATFLASVAMIIGWAACGPLFGFSETWQLVINTATTIVTFLMVFLIQNTQNRDNAAIQAKLDELIRVTNAKNGFIGIEKLTDKELEEILADFEEVATPLGVKSRVIDRKAKQVRARNAREKRSGEAKAGRAAASKLRANARP